MDLHLRSSRLKSAHEHAASQGTRLQLELSKRIADHGQTIGEVKQLNARISLLEKNFQDGRNQENQVRSELSKGTAEHVQVVNDTKHLNNRITEIQTCHRYGKHEPVDQNFRNGCQAVSPSSREVVVDTVGSEGREVPCLTSKFIYITSSSKRDSRSFFFSCMQPLDPARFLPVTLLTQGGTDIRFQRKLAVDSTPLVSNIKTRSSSGERAYYQILGPLPTSHDHANVVICSCAAEWGR